MTSISSRSLLNASTTPLLLIRVPPPKTSLRLFALAPEHEVILELAEIVLRGEHEPARVQAVEARRVLLDRLLRSPPAADRGRAKNLQKLAIVFSGIALVAFSCGLWEPTLLS